MDRKTTQQQEVFQIFGCIQTMLLVALTSKTTDILKKPLKGKV